VCVCVLLSSSWYISTCHQESNTDSWCIVLLIAATVLLSDRLFAFQALFERRLMPCGA